MCLQSLPVFDPMPFSIWCLLVTWEAAGAFWTSSLSVPSGQTTTDLLHLEGDCCDWPWDTAEVLRLEGHFCYWPCFANVAEWVGLWCILTGSTEEEEDEEKARMVMSSFSGSLSGVSQSVSDMFKPSCHLHCPFLKDGFQESIIG